MKYGYGYKSEVTLVKGPLFGGSRTVGHNYIQLDLREAS
jgi:hypothetical protein